MKTFDLAAYEGVVCAGAADLVPGDRAKLFFRGPRRRSATIYDATAGHALPWTVAGERMWAFVLERRADVYLGELRNEPLGVDGAIGDKFLFRAEHVIEWKRGTEGLARFGMRLLNWVMRSR